MSDIILSILVPTYGHEKYIRKALDSILIQRTRYRYEVIVGEDASPDNTREILKEYKKRFPDIFTMIYRNKNAGGFGNGNCMDLLTRAKGKYLAFLEGDDFWISCTKIEEQVSFLETHPDYVAVGCNTIVVDENSNMLEERYPECRDEEYTLKHFRKNILPGQTSCMMYRIEICKEIYSDLIWNSNPVPGDKILFLGAVTKGRICCIQKEMSAYRHIVSKGFSYSANKKKDFYEQLDWYVDLISFSRRLKRRNAVYAAKGTCLAFLFWDGLRNKKISFFVFLKIMAEVKITLYVLILKVLDFLFEIKP